MVGLVFLIIDESMGEERQLVWPGQGPVLVPPPDADLLHVEPKQECQVSAHRTQVGSEVENKGSKLRLVLFRQCFSGNS